MKRNLKWNNNKVICFGWLCRFFCTDKMSFNAKTSKSVTVKIEFYHISKLNTRVAAIKTVGKMEELVEHVNTSVAPQYRSNVDIKKFHRFMLTGSKIKKQHTDRKKKKPMRPSKALSRKQSSDLGLYTLPTKALKYTDMMALHELWMQYIYDHLRSFLVTENGEQRIPHVYENTYDAFSKALVKSDFHGANITVIGSKSPSLVGQNGIVAMETKNTFKIVGKDNQTRSK